MSERLNLWCLLKDGKKGFTIFPVDIFSDEWVYNLQAAIRTTKSNDLGHIDADKLILWKVEIPTVKDAVYDRDYKQSVDTFKSDRPASPGTSTSASENFFEKFKRHRSPPADVDVIKRQKMLQ
ncbi:hypothetical protein BGX21_007175, partial [Mortierella sp. AD011]